VNYDAQLIGPGRCQAPTHPQPWPNSAPGRAPSGQGSVRSRQEAPVPVGASARSGRGIRRLCVLGVFSVPSVVSRCLPLRLCGGHSKSRLARCQQALPGPTKPDRPLQNLRHKSRIASHQSRFTSHESPASALGATAGRPLTSHQPLVPGSDHEPGSRCADYARYRDTSHFSIPYTLGNRNQCNSLKTHADAMFYPLHSPGVVHIVFILKGSAN